MSENINEFEKFVPIEIMDLDRFSIAELSNKVLIEINEEEVEKSVGGVITKGIKKFAFAKNTVRRGKVIKTCDKITPTRNENDFIMWQTDIQIQPGDEVWLNYFDVLNSYDLVYGERKMKMVPYVSIICTVRNNEVIMCNGYTLLEDYEEVIGAGPFSYKVKKKEQGIIRYIGKPNKRYYLPIMIKDHSKYIGKGMASSKIYGTCDGHYLVANKLKSDPGPKQLKVGDRVLIDDIRRVFNLEEWAYARFDNRKLYRVCQQSNIIAKFL